jgi:hypothetical protein
VLLARLAELHAHVDEAGRQDFAAAIHALAIERRRVLEQGGAEIANEAALGDERALDVGARGGIDNTGVDIGDGAAAAVCAGQQFATSTAGALERSERVRMSRQAMRTATPISTCSWITLLPKSSATSLSISTPRFMGPGCMMSASGLAAPSLS